MKIYLACSFAYKDRNKTEARKQVMRLVKQNLADKGFDVYNPSELVIENAWDYTMHEWGRLVFEADHQALDSCDAVVFLSFGKENSSGAVWEIGYAYGKNIPIVMVSMANGDAESLMCIHSARAVLNGLDGFFAYDLNSLAPRYELNNATES